MRPADPQPGSGRTLRYRLEIEGELGEARAAWLGAEQVRVGGGRTLLELAVPDEAALHGVLRRLHDLRLRLVSLDRLGTGDESDNAVRGA